MCPQGTPSCCHFWPQGQRRHGWRVQESLTECRVLLGRPLPPRPSCPLAFLQPHPPRGLSLCGSLLSVCPLEIISRTAHVSCCRSHCGRNTRFREMAQSLTRRRGPAISRVPGVCPRAPQPGTPSGKHGCVYGDDLMAPGINSASSYTLIIGCFRK